MQSTENCYQQAVVYVLDSSWDDLRQTIPSFPDNQITEAHDLSRNPEQIKASTAAGSLEDPRLCGLTKWFFPSPVALLGARGSVHLDASFIEMRIRLHFQPTRNPWSNGEQEWIDKWKELKKCEGRQQPQFLSTH